MNDNTVTGCSQTMLTRFRLFLTTYPPALTSSTVWALTKSGHFKTTYLPRLVNVVCEQPLNAYLLSILFKILLVILIKRTLHLRCEISSFLILLSSKKCIFVLWCVSFLTAFKKQSWAKALYTVHNRIKGLYFVKEIKN